MQLIYFFIFLTFFMMQSFTPESLPWVKGKHLFGLQITLKHELYS